METNIEAKLKELEEIVAKIESGDIELASALKEYEKAKALIEDLEKSLKEAEEKVEKIVTDK